MKHSALIRYLVSPFRFRILLMVTLLIPGLINGVGTRFLIIPATVSQISLGPSPVIGDQTYFNPALTGEGRWYSASGGKWLADTPFSGFHISGPLSGGRFAVMGRYIGMDDLELRHDYPTDEPVALFSAYGLSFSAAYSRALERLRIGASLGVINTGIYTETASGISLSSGISYQLFQGIHLGAALLNAGRMSNLRNEEPVLPLRGSFGLKIDNSSVNWKNEFALSADLTRGRRVAFHVAEIITWRSIAIMAGTELQKDNFNVSGGINFYSGSLRIGYGFRVGQNRLGLAQLVEISVRVR